MWEPFIDENLMKRPVPNLVALSLSALPLLALGLSAQSPGISQRALPKKGKIRVPVRVFGPSGKLFKNAKVFFLRQVLSAPRVVHDDRYGYQAFRFDPDPRGRFHVRLPRGGNWSAYAFGEQKGKRLASRLTNEVFAGRILNLHLLEDKRKTLVVDGLAPWRKRFGPGLVLEVYANSSVNGLVPGPSSPHFRLPLQSNKSKQAFPDRFEVRLPPLPRESFWLALLDAKGSFLESLFLGRRQTSRIGPLSFGTPIFRPFQLQDEAGAPLADVRVLVRSGTPIVTAERLVKTDAKGRVLLPYGEGKWQGSLQEDVDPVALFLPLHCSVLYREVKPVAGKSKDALESEVHLTAVKDKKRGSKGYVFDSGSLAKGVRYVQLVGAVSKTGFVRNQIVPLPKESLSFPNKVFFLPSSGGSRGEWNGLLRLEGGQASPAWPEDQGGVYHIQKPSHYYLLTIFRPGRERSFGGRIVLEVQEKVPSEFAPTFLIPFSADSHGKVSLHLPFAPFGLLAYEPRVGIYEGALGLQPVPDVFEKDLVLTPFYELLIQVRGPNKKPLDGARCRWEVSVSPQAFLNRMIKMQLLSRVLGLGKRGRAKADRNGVIRLFFHPGVSNIALQVKAKVGGRWLQKNLQVVARDGVHRLNVVLK